MKIQLQEGLIVEAISICGLDYEEWENARMEMLNADKDLISVGDVAFDGSTVIYNRSLLAAGIYEDMIYIS
jgi:hypothetical protein